MSRFDAEQFSFEKPIRVIEEQLSSVTLTAAATPVNDADSGPVAQARRLRHELETLKQLIFANLES